MLDEQHGQGGSYVMDPKPLPPIPSAGGTYVLNGKGTEWIVEQQTAEPSAVANPKPLNPETDGTDS